MKNNRSVLRCLIPIVSVVFVSGCLNKNSSKLKTDGEYQSVTIAIKDDVPGILTHFMEALTGRSKRMHDFGFSHELPKALSGKATISQDVIVKVNEKQDTGIDGAMSNVQIPIVHRGVVIGDVAYVFKQETSSGGPAERGPWWYPVARVPVKYLLEGKPLEEKIKYGLQTLIYDKEESARVNAELDGLEFMLNFLPAYGGAKEFFYEGNATGVAWMVGDVATLGMAAKAKAVANVSRGVVIAAASFRVGNGIYELSQGEANAATAVDVTLATFEAGLAVIGLANLKIRTVNRTRVQNIDELVDGIGKEKALVVDAGSAQVLGKRLGRSSDDILQNGVSREEIAKIAGRKLSDNLGDGNQTLATLAARLGARTENLSDSSIRDLLSGPFRGQILTSEIDAIKAKVARGEFPDPTELQKLLSVSTPSNPNAMVNVTNNSTLEKVLEADGLYWGFLDPKQVGQPRGLYATSRPISWNTLDLMGTAGTGAGINRNTMLVFIGQASEKFGLVRSDGLLGQGVALTKTFFKKNSEFATRGGDVIFRDFKIFTDGTKNIVVVRQLDLPGTLHSIPFGTPEYKNLIKTSWRDLGFTMVMDANAGFIVAGSSLLSLGAGIIGGAELGDVIFNGD
jgi:hypothetical protein